MPGRRGEPRRGGRSSGAAPQTASRTDAIASPRSGSSDQARYIDGTPTTPVTWCRAIRASASAGSKRSTSTPQAPWYATAPRPGVEPVRVEERQRQQQRVVGADHRRLDPADLLVVGHQRAVGEHRALRPALGARGVEQDREVARRSRPASHGGTESAAVVGYARPARAGRPGGRPRSPRHGRSLGDQQRRRRSRPARAAARGAVYLGLTGTATSPARSTANSATAKSGCVGQRDRDAGRVRVAGEVERGQAARGQRRPGASSSPQVTTVSCQISAGRSGVAAAVGGHPVGQRLAERRYLHGRRVWHSIGVADTTSVPVPGPAPRRPLRYRARDSIRGIARVGSCQPDG